MSQLDLKIPPPLVAAAMAGAMTAASVWLPPVLVLPLSPSVRVGAALVLVGVGACFDVAAYYLGAAEKFRDSSRGLEHVTASDVAMLEKTHGRHTFMLQERAILNGVALPKGTLMQQGADGGWAMLRLTPFCFDSPEDQLATGSELAKAYANETQAITSIGGVSLAHIVAASAPTLHRSRGFFGLR